MWIKFIFKIKEIVRENVELKNKLSVRDFMIKTKDEDISALKSTLQNLESEIFDKNVLLDRYERKEREKQNDPMTLRDQMEMNKEIREMRRLIEELKEAK